jgi:hypothetical protein
VHWREEEYYPSPPAFVAQANAADAAILERFTEDKFPERDPGKLHVPLTHGEKNGVG